ncbi:MAG TPA: MGMT family protein [Myxococcota bacterium]|jgi:methylated-DNA-protein-cysteine methyltransferase-like protein|nr:MGMT family protein [Myxococcota bacterium]
MARRTRQAPARRPRGWDRFYRLVERIPRGRVSTYGAVAAMAGMPRGARHVGFALAALTGTRHGVPWHRVLGARPRGHAGVSLRDPVAGALQRLMLEKEGVRFDARGRVAMAEFGWRGPLSRRGAGARGRRPRGAGRRRRPQRRQQDFGKRRPAVSGRRSRYRSIDSPRR